MAEKGEREKSRIRQLVDRLLENDKTHGFLFDSPSLVLIAKWKNKIYLVYNTGLTIVLKIEGKKVKLKDWYIPFRNSVFELEVGEE